MEEKKDYYGGLGSPLLHGSEEFRKKIGKGGADYYKSVLVSCDFSGELGLKIHYKLTGGLNISVH